MLILTHRSTQKGRKEADTERIVHPMDILLATLLTCEEAKSITDKVKLDAVKTELVEVLKMSTEKGCDWDANVD